MIFTISLLQDKPSAERHRNNKNRWSPANYQDAEKRSRSSFPEKTSNP
jgi:hypothetical protein